MVVFQGPIVFVGLGCTPADTLKLQCTPRDVTGPAHRNLSRAHWRGKSKALEPMEQPFGDVCFYPLHGLYFNACEQLSLSTVHLYHVWKLPPGCLHLVSSLCAQYKNNALHLQPFKMSEIHQIQALFPQTWSKSDISAFPSKITRNWLRREVIRNFGTSLWGFVCLQIHFRRSKEYEFMVYKQYKPMVKSSENRQLYPGGGNIGWFLLWRTVNRLHDLSDLEI